MPRISLGEDLGGGRVGEAKPTLAGGGLAKPSELALINIINLKSNLYSTRLTRKTGRAAERGLAKDYGQHFHTKCLCEQ